MLFGSLQRTSEKGKDRNTADNLRDRTSHFRYERYLQVNMPFMTTAQSSALLRYIDHRPSAHVNLHPNRGAFAQNKQDNALFPSGLPMSGATFQRLMLLLSRTHGVRCIASDRRGFGRSKWQGPESVNVTL